MISGVCAGLAHRLDVDVALVRALFVGSIVFSGFGLFAYLTLWYLLDPAPLDADLERPLITRDNRPDAADELGLSDATPAFMRDSGQVSDNVHPD